MNKRAVIALVIILVLTWCAYKGYESKYFFHIPFYQKHLINFGLLFGVAIAGLYGLQGKRQWLKSLWLMLYAFIILLMAIIGLLDLFFRFEISNFREMVHDLRMFFCSPVPFAFLLFLNYKLKSKAN